jgi:hypothetical protein
VVDPLTADADVGSGAADGNGEPRSCEPLHGVFRILACAQAWTSTFDLSPYVCGSGVDSPPAGDRLDDREPAPGQLIERDLTGGVLEAQALIHHFDQQTILIKLTAEEDPSNAVRDGIRHQLAHA